MLDTRELVIVAVLVGGVPAWLVAAGCASLLDTLRERNGELEAE